MIGLHKLERRTDRLAPLPVFLSRLWGNLLIAVAIVAFSLTLGTLGYHYLGAVP